MTNGFFFTLFSEKEFMTYRRSTYIFIIDHSSGKYVDKKSA